MSYGDSRGRGRMRDSNAQRGPTGNQPEREATCRTTLRAWGAASSAKVFHMFYI